MPRRSLGLLVGLLSLLAAGQADAVSVTIGVVGGSTTDLASHGTATTPNEEGGEFEWTLDYAWHGDGYTVDSWQLQLKEDPFVTNNLHLTNTGGVTATFVATVLLPIPAFAYDTVVMSSVGVTVTDSDTTTPLLYDVSGVTPIYQGFVNFPVSTVLLSMNPITPGTLPITTADCLPFVFPGCTATSSNGVVSLGVPAGVATLIGITLTFQLSAGDSVGMTSRFEIINVPEPTSLALVGVGLVALVLARRRAH